MKFIKAMATTITHLSGLEILDSRGRPTVQAMCQLASGAIGIASAPSGASTGAAEAHELRDGYSEAAIGALVVAMPSPTSKANWRRTSSGCAFTTQQEIDQAMIALDGTPSKGRLQAPMRFWPCPSPLPAPFQPGTPTTTLSLFCHPARSAICRSCPAPPSICSVAANMPVGKRRSRMLGGRQRSETIDDVMAMTVAVFQLPPTSST